MPASTNLFDARASWPIPPTEAPTVDKTEQAERRTPSMLATISCTLVLNKPQHNKSTEEECRWELHCPICTNSTPEAEDTEDWNGKRQDSQQRKLLPPRSQIPPSIWHSGQVFSATKFGEGMEWEDGTADQKIQFRLLFQFRIWLWIWVRA